MKLVLKLFCTICALMVIGITGQDFYYDERGKTYVIDSFGNRRYSGSEESYKAPVFEEPKEAILDFAMNLFKNVDGEQFVVAPLSPQILLSCLAKESEGETKSQIVKAIGYENSQELEKLLSNMQKEGTNRELLIGNGFFVNTKRYNDLKKSFWDQEKSQDRLIDVTRVNFKDKKSATKTYTNWVKSKTKKILKTVDTDFDESTEMLLGSTIYFKGQWLFSFNITQKSNYRLTPNQNITVDTMTIRKKFHSGTFDNIDARWAAIPYNSTESMIIIMPNDNETLDNVIEKLNGTDIKDIINVVTGHPTLNLLNITLPKFKLTTTVQLRETLQKLKIRDLFTHNSKLTLYNSNETLSIASALQQSYLEVDELGSIGASTTTFSAIALSVQPEIKNTDFIVDRPFIALIVDRKYAVPYFMAKVFDPRS